MGKRPQRTGLAGMNWPTAFAGLFNMGMGAYIGLALQGAPLQAQEARTGRLEVVMRGFRSAEGEALVSIYASEATWLKRGQAHTTLRLPIQGGVAKAVIEKLPVGTYAVSVIHDQNRNGKLDMVWFPYPRPGEGAGASNDPQALIGPPAYEDARVKVHEKGTTIAVTVRY